MTAAIDFYFWSTPNGWKVAIALCEMGVPFNLRLVNINKGEQFSPAFKEISPNSRIPAIVDHDGPDGEPVSVFESGAILQYLGRKTGKFYGATERERIKVDEWIMWQMGNLGPMAGQAHHFLHYAPLFDPPVVDDYAQNRYRNEVARLYGVLDAQLGRYSHCAGDFYSIADMCIWPWISRHERQQRRLEDTPNVKRWFDEMWARPAVQQGRNIASSSEVSLKSTFGDPDTQRVLFGAGKTT